MNSDNIKTYAVGNGEITLSDTDAEELRIILQTEHVRNVMASIVRNNIGDLNLPGKRCERSLIDWLTDAFGEYITIDPETDIHVVETAEDMMFGRAEELGWYGDEGSRRIAKLTNVEFYGTGGGCVLFSALVNDSAWLSTDFDSVMYTESREDSHRKDPEGPLPTWGQIFDAIREHFPGDVSRVGEIAKRINMKSLCTANCKYPLNSDEV